MQTLNDSCSEKERDHNAGKRSRGQSRMDRKVVESKLDTEISDIGTGRTSSLD
jgi:hypothetical protein